MNAVRITDTRFNLAQHAIPAAAIVLYGKGTADDDFVKLTSGYTITEQVKTVNGVAYTFTHVDFSSAKEDGYEVRWDGEGMTDTGDSTGTVVEGPVQCIQLYLVRVVGKDEFTELDTASFKDTAAVVDAIELGAGQVGMKCGGAIMKRMNHREALTQLCRSFGLELFTTKRGLIAIRYIGAEPSVRPTLDDVQDIYLKSETHDLAAPVYNVVNYKFMRMYSTQEWNQEEVARNEDAVASWGKEETTDLPMAFVRDPFTALRVVESLTWVAPEAFRIVFSTPGHRTTPQVELASWLGITNYSGLDETGGGYVDRTFLVHKTNFNLDTKKLTVHAITRLQPVPGQGAVQGNVENDARYGPYYGGPGKFTGIFVDRDDPKKLVAQSSSDWGASWAEADEANSPTFGGNIEAYDSILDRQNSRQVLVVTQEAGNGAVALHKFNLTSQTWEETHTTVWAGASGWEAPYPMAQIDRSRLSGRLGVFFSRLQDPNASGEYGGDRNRTAWTYSDDDGASWSAPADIGQNTTGASAWGELYSYHGGRIVAGAGDRFHFFYNREPGNFVRSTEDEYHRTATSSGALTGEVVWTNTGLSWYAAPYNYGWPCSYLDGTDVRIRVELKGSSDARVYRPAVRRYAGQYHQPGRCMGQRADSP